MKTRGERWSSDWGGFNKCTCMFVLVERRLLSSSFIQWLICSQIRQDFTSLHSQHQPTVGILSGPHLVTVCFFEEDLNSRFSTMRSTSCHSPHHAHIAGGKPDICTISHLSHYIFMTSVSRHQMEGMVSELQARSRLPHFKTACQRL